MSKFHERLATALDNSRKYAGNRARLSRALKKNPNYVSAILQTRTSPELDVAVQIARELEVSLPYLAGTTSQPFDLADLWTDGPIPDHTIKFVDQIADTLRDAVASRDKEPTIEGLMVRWHKFGKRLSGFEQIKDWFDLYKAPRDGCNRLEVVRMGANSFASRTLGNVDEKSLQYSLDELRDSALRLRLLASYRAAAEGRPILSQEALNVWSAGNKAQIRLDYIRLLLPVEMAFGELAILNYSKPIA